MCVERAVVFPAFRLVDPVIIQVAAAVTETRREHNFLVVHRHKMRIFFLSIESSNSSAAIKKPNQVKQKRTEQRSDGNRDVLLSECKQTIEKEAEIERPFPKKTRRRSRYS